VILNRFSEVYCVSLLVSFLIKEGALQFLGRLGSFRSDLLARRGAAFLDQLLWQVVGFELQKIGIVTLGWVI
jgi:hypothetical protein